MDPKRKSGSDESHRKRSRSDDPIDALSHTSLTTEFRCLDRNQAKGSVSLVQHNNHGVDLFKKGEVKTASLIFQQLLKTLSPNKITKDSGIGRVPTVPTNRIHQQDQVDRPTRMKRQYLEYDEGLDFFSDPQTLLKRSHPNVVRATLLYNVGQAVRKEHSSLQKASSFFQLALDQLLPHLSSPKEAALIPQLNRLLIPVLNCVALIEYKSGAIEQAHAYYRLALDYAREGKDPNDLSLGASLNGLGTVLLSQSKENEGFEESLKCILESADIFTRRLGADTTQIASVYNNMGRCYAKLGDPDNSLVAFNKARMLRERLLGPKHIDYGAALFNTAQNLQFMQRYEEALPLYHSFLDIAESAFTETHRDVAIGLSHIANCYHRKGDPNSAQTYFDRSVQIGRQAFRTEPIEIAALLGEAGKFYFDIENFCSALAVYQEAFAIEESILESDHPSVTLTLGNIAESYRRMGRLDESIGCYKKVADLLKKRQGAQSAKAAAALTVVGLVQEQNGEVYEAINTLQEALLMKKIALGEEHVDCSQILLYLGTIFCRVRRVSDALGLLKEAYDQFVAQLGYNDASVACTLYNTGVCHQQQGDPDKAIQSFRNALEIYRKLPKNAGRQRQIASVLFKLGEMLSFEGLHEEALTHLQEAYRILRCETVFDAKDPDTLTCTLEKLCGLHIRMGETEKMMNVLAETARLFRCLGIPLERINISSALKEYEVRSIAWPSVA